MVASKPKNNLIKKVPSYWEIVDLLQEIYKSDKLPPDTRHKISGVLHQIGQ